MGGWVDGLGEGDQVVGIMGWLEWEEGVADG